MVITIILSEYSSAPPTAVGRVKIASPGPLYDLTRVQALAADENQLVLWTAKCRKDVLNLFDSDLAQLGGLIQALTPADYIDSEWCENGRGALAACDAYRVRRQEWAPATGKPMTVSYFLKFAIGKTGRLVLVVSCHV
jgi:hypothetical protein